MPRKKVKKWFGGRKTKSCVYLIYLPIHKSCGEWYPTPEGVYKIGYTDRTIDERIIEHLGGKRRYEKHKKKVVIFHCEVFSYRCALTNLQKTELKCIDTFKKNFEKYHGKEWFIIDDIYKAINIIKCERWNVEKWINNRHPPAPVALS